MIPEIVFEDEQNAAPEKWFDYPRSRGEKYLIRYTPKSLIGKVSDAELFEMVLVDWAGVLDKEKNPVPCNAEMRLAFFVRDSFAAAKRREWIVLKAVVPGNFIELDELLKNSVAP